MKVFQVKQAKFPLIFIGADQLKFPEDYDLVAEVEEKENSVEGNLENAYYLTNTVDKPWMQNPGVKVIQGSRSTSVGDVVELDGKRYQVRSLGWNEI